MEDVRCKMEELLSHTFKALNASPIRDIILKSWEDEQNFKNISRLSDKVGQRPAQM